MYPLLTVSPCEHGNRLTVLEIQEGMEFVDPGCRLKSGDMRYHKATSDKYDLAPIRKADGRFVVPWLKDSEDWQ